MSTANEKPPRTRSTTFTIRSIFVITTVFAAGAVSMGYLFRAANGNTDEIGWFVIITMLMPLALMVAMSWTFRITKWMGKKDISPLAILGWLGKRILRKL